MSAAATTACVHASKSGSSTTTLASKLERLFRNGLTYWRPTVLKDCTNADSAIPVFSVFPRTIRCAGSGQPETTEL